MKFLGVSLLSCWCLVISAWAQNLTDRIRQMEAAGDARGARVLLEDTVRDEPGNIDSLTTFAEFLDRHGDPQASDIYSRLLDLTADDEHKARIARRLFALDLVAGGRDAAARHLAIYRDAGGAGLEGSIPPATGRNDVDYAEAPGSLESLSRMAAFSNELEPDEVLPALARNIITSGYKVSIGDEGLHPTEYMKLLNRYLSQARELEQIAGAGGAIRIEQCESSETADLLRVLGYRMRGGCGSEVILETVNATRAFLTIDSGFPLAELEQALRTNRPFDYDFRPTRLPVLYGRDFWLTPKDREEHGTFVDALLSDPSLCRLYLAMSNMDRPTADALRARASMERLKAFAHVLDFFGSLFLIEDGTAVVPGGPATRKAWSQLVGVSPEKGAEFFERLIATDDGWLASYYDSLRRVEGPTEAYLTQPERLVRFYEAIRGRITSPGPARPVFRANGELMLLTSGMWLEEDGTPHLPGDIEVWKRLFADSPDEIYDGRLKRTAARWTGKDDVLEALFALCRKPIENQPLHIYMALSSVNRGRAQPLDPVTVNIMARSWPEFGTQYQLFAETPLISAGTIREYLSVAQQIDSTGNRMLRADLTGSMQALTSLWQIFVRNGAISDDKVDSTLAEIVSGFADVSDKQELFDHDRHSIELLAEVTGKPGDQPLQQHMLALLTGAAHPQDAETQNLMLDEMRRIFEAQKLVSLDDILDVADHLEALANGAQLDTSIVNRLASRLEEIHSHREGLSGVERSTLSFGHWSERHIEEQQKLQLRNEIRKAVGSPNELRDLRGELTGILRDTLVGYNYLHYAPPGAQLLRTNPLFVRSHGFLGTPGRRSVWQETRVFAAGWPVSGGGRLLGSLSGLAYSLADAEQNFLVPSSEQALIWTDLVPQMIVTAKVPRWWNVSPELMHWTALHTRVARSAVAEAVVDADRRELVVSTLNRKASPGRLREVVRQIEAGEVPDALANITPAELFLIGAAVTERSTANDPLTAEIRRLASAHPATVNHEAVSRAFGSPKPTLLKSYRPHLLHLPTFPTLMGYSSRIMAESWESNLIYYATLADSLYLRPSQLNVKVPEWTRVTVETIFANHLEDWPAVLRSLRRVGEEVSLAIQPESDEAARIAAIQRQSKEGRQ